MCPPDLHDVNSYHYDLPEELIAQYPLKDRTSSRLMVVDTAGSEITHRHFADIIEYLEAGDLLIVNNSKVFPARLYAKKENGNEVELLLTTEIRPNVWKTMVHPGKRLKTEQDLILSDGTQVRIGLADEDGFRIVEFPPDFDFWDRIYRIGHVPLPPYIDRADEAGDLETYQTVYADQPGSIAAPTAGFHFSEQLISELKGKGIRFAEVLLHVGIGTFKPVKAERIEDHVMHSEYCSISPEVADLYNSTREAGKRIIAVGTTSLRTLQSFYDGHRLQAGAKWTDIFIYPGRKADSIDALITNFHLPKSTLLMLVSAFAGYELTRRAYQEAVKNGYRFFSYGDAMFIKGKKGSDEA